MKIVSAVDSFKGCLSSDEINNCVEKGVKHIFDHAEVVKIPVADGGEGTLDSLIKILNGKIINKKVKNPLGEIIESKYGIIQNIAVIEMALASGLPLIKAENRNIMKANTYGTGELIADALEKGCTNFIIGIGGSATNDAGMGMLEALGVKFYDENQNLLNGNGENLIKIKSFDITEFSKKLKDTNFTIACDVNNPFYGENGAAYIYAKQKGADENMIIELDKGLESFSNLIKSTKRIDLQKVAGAGAAGGLGGAFMSFFNSELKSGIDIILETIKFDKIIKGADFIFTGEGRIDSQSAMGKTISGIARYAKKENIPVVGIAGSVTDDIKALHNIGIQSCFPTLNTPMTLEQAMEKENAKKRIIFTVEQICRIINLKK